MAPRLVSCLRHEVDEDGNPCRVNGLVITGGGGSKTEEYKEFDVVVAATDVPGIKKLLPESFRKYVVSFRFLCFCFLFSVFYFLVFSFSDSCLVPVPLLAGWRSQRVSRALASPASGCRIGGGITRDVTHTGRLPLMLEMAVRSILGTCCR